MPGNRPVVWAKIHIDSAFTVVQATVATLEFFAMGAAMNLPVDIRNRDCAEIFVLVRPEEMQHLVQSQALHPVQQHFMAMRFSLGPQNRSRGFHGEAKYQGGERNP